MDTELLEGEKPSPRPGFRFEVFGRTDERHRGGNSWMGLGNMKEGLDWHRIDPPIQELPEGFGWLYREVVNAPRT